VASLRSSGVAAGKARDPWKSATFGKLRGFVASISCLLIQALRLDPAHIALALAAFAWERQ
jgi:hypothetical protein